jgi:hypothetical protein
VVMGQVWIASTRRYGACLGLPQVLPISFRRYDASVFWGLKLVATTVLGVSFWLRLYAWSLVLVLFSLVSRLCARMYDSLLCELLLGSTWVIVLCKHAAPGSLTSIYVL